jgi:drug/metabolite transporter (DMT)-like permease
VHGASERSGAGDVVTQARPPGRTKLAVSFFIVYVVWGSSFLAGRLGVQALPPLLFSCGRALVAGLLLLAVARYRGDTLPQTAREWRLMAFFALTMIVFSNGPVMFALQHLPSNEVALLNASIAFWIAWFGTLGPQGQPLRARSWLGLAVGFAGVALLVWRGEFRLDAHFGWQLVVLAASVIWATGTIVYRNSAVHAEPVAFNAALMLLGAAGLFVGAIATGELPDWTWAPGGIAAMLYLAVFSSALTYTAYAFLIKNARTDHVATFAYVNPAIATLLGWVVLDEALSPPQVAGMLVVLAGVMLVTLPSRLA